MHAVAPTRTASQLRLRAATVYTAQKNCTFERTCSRCALVRKVPAVAEMVETGEYGEGLLVGGAYGFTGVVDGAGAGAGAGPKVGPMRVTVKVPQRLSAQTLPK